MFMLLYWQSGDEYTALNDSQYFHNFNFNIHVNIFLICYGRSQCYERQFVLLRHGNW
jgi:hypothetical protein